MNKLSKEDMDLIVGSIKNSITPAMCNGVVYHIKPFLSAQEQSDFVQELISVVSINDEYSPAMFEFAERYCAVKYFTNLVLPKDQEAVNGLLFGTDIIDDVRQCVNYDYLVDAAKEQIKRTHETVISLIAANKQDPMERIVNMIGDFLDKIGNSLDGIDGAKLNDMLGKINGLDEAKIVEAVTATNKTKKTTTKNKKPAVKFPDKQIVGQISAEEFIKDSE